ncbi:concanavalin A-like lectin/glucanase domain-containing protein [Phycomyces nitens]|nr:concanavalin A-like lectin/glucanase domain-containing protein [Phycomyces nitens]
MNYTVTSTRAAALDRKFDPDNIECTSKGIELTVKSDSKGEFTSASFGSRSTNLLYGTYRVHLKTSDVPGTIAAMFLRNEETEIDIELLSQYKDPARVHYAVHPQIYRPDGSPSPLTFGLKTLSFDPTKGFHEYRLDWLPGRIDYFTDGLQTHQLSKNIPREPGRIVINHWTDGNPNFGGAPPVKPAVLYVSKFSMMFNKTGDTGPLACKKVSKACSINGKHILFFFSLYIIPTNFYIDITMEQVSKGTPSSNSSTIPTSSLDTLNIVPFGSPSTTHSILAPSVEPSSVGLVNTSLAPKIKVYGTFIILLALGLGSLL